MQRYPPPTSRESHSAVSARPRLRDNMSRTLVALASVPLGCIPESVHSQLLCEVLNRVLGPELGDGELDFLKQRCLAIHIPELNTRFRLSLSGARLRPATHRAPDLTLRGGVREFLQLATRIEDPDTLFFQRRLHLDGDAELGLLVKNFLDALELDDARLPPWAVPLADLARRVACRIASASRPA
ncbi:MAG: SCP2 sterol-binding domain-containing protein [Gammaproteobacteria bacterium]|nr:SCP2 sterol-binding domain-containing protein [Gammaproteobacteria bacterium]